MVQQNLRSYKDLEVWKKGIDFAKEIYNMTKDFPSEDKFSLVNQMRRTAVSIPSNIAEGHARIATVEFMRFISISLGSFAELETQLILSKELNFINESIQDKHLLRLREEARDLRLEARSLNRRIV